MIYENRQHYSKKCLDYDKWLSFGKDWFEGIPTFNINGCSRLRDIVCGIFYRYIYIQECLQQSCIISIASTILTRIPWKIRICKKSNLKFKKINIGGRIQSKADAIQEKPFIKHAIIVATSSLSFFTFVLKHVSNILCHSKKSKT